MVASKEKIHTCKSIQLNNNVYTCMPVLRSLHVRNTRTQYRYTRVMSE